MILCGWLLCGQQAEGQNITGQINGTVRDPSGAAIAGAQVSVINTDTNELVRTLTTGKSGDFTASLLTVGTYTITAKATGFGEERLTEIAVDVGSSVTRDFKLSAGTTAEITVNSSALSPNIETNENATLIGNAEIQELALNTRNFQQLLLLQPGVSYGGPDELQTGQVSPTGQRNSHALSINGLQPSQVLFTLDGADMLNHTSNGQVSVFPSIGAINQVQTVRNNYGAQYGGGGGAQVTIATRAGAADYHGELYYFFRNAGLNATPYFNLLTVPVTPKPDIHYNQYGYDVGGPVIFPKLLTRAKSKTFFFFSQEFRRQDTPTSRIAGNTPTLASTFGYFSSAVCTSLNAAGKCDNTQPRAVAVTNSPFPGANFRICVANDPLPCPAGAPVANSVSSAYLKDIFQPSAMQTPAPVDPTKPNNVVLAQNSSTSETQESLRVDQQFSERLNGFARFVYDPITQHIPNALYSGNGNPGVSTTTVQSYGLNILGHLTWTARPTTVVEVGFSYLPYQTKATPTGFIVSQAALNDIHINLPFPNTTGRVPSISLVASSFFGAVGPITDKSETFQLFENTTQTLGRHVLYFGVNLEHLTDSANVGTTNAGLFNFQAGASGGNNQPDQSFGIFLGGNATSFTQSSVDAYSHPDENLYEAYVQDVWRATSTLTLNAGVRYSIFQAPGDYSSDTSANHAFPNGKLGGFQPQAYNASLAPTIGLDGSLCTNATASAPVCTPIAPINSQYNLLNGIAGGGAGPSPYGRAISRTPLLDFAPRVGFALNVYGDGRTSLRGGFGIYYNQQPLITFQNAIAGNPAYVQNPYYPNPPSFANPAQGSGSSGSAVNTISGVTRAWKQPYVEAWSLGLQQQLTKATLLEVGYVGNNTQHLQGEEDLNQPMPGVYIGTGVTGCVNGVATAACEPTNNGTFLCVPGNTTIKCPTENALNRIRPYLGYGPINFQSTRFFSDYNGLQASVIHRAGKGLTFGGSYTFSKALANSGGPPNGGFNQEQFDPQNRFDLKSEWGPTLLDRRHVATFHGVYKLPVRRQWHGLTNVALNGWEVSTIIQWRTGSWFTAHSDGNDAGGQGALGTGSNARVRPQQNGNPNNYLKTQANWFNDTVFSSNIPLGQAGGSEKIGAIEGPGYQNYTLDVFKNFEIRDHLRFQLRGECFNCVNHVNFQSIGTQLGSTNFGSVISAYENRTMQLAAKLTF